MHLLKSRCIYQESGNLAASSSLAALSDFYACRLVLETSSMGCGPQTCLCKGWKQMQTGASFAPMKLQDLQIAGVMSMLSYMSAMSGRVAQKES